MEPCWADAAMRARRPKFPPAVASPAPKAAPSMLAAIAVISVIAALKSQSSPGSAGAHRRTSAAATTIVTARSRPTPEIAAASRPASDAWRTLPPSRVVMNPAITISTTKPTKLRESSRLSLIQAVPVAVKVPSNFDAIVIDAETAPKIRARRIQAFIESPGPDDAFLIEKLALCSGLVHQREREARRY